jgi:ubiquinone/menaquinone biosynthesis C-methylase UbiE
MREHRGIGIGLIALGLLFLAAWWWAGAATGSLAAMGGGAVMAGFAFVSGLAQSAATKVAAIEVPWVGVKFVLREPPPRSIEGLQPTPKDISPQLRAQREAWANTLELPGADAPAFNILTESRDLRVAPGADATVPMYLLDRDFRILDWNSAFALAFDRTMEGRRGLSVLEWTYLLDNYEQVLDHGVKVFSNGQPPPRIDVEEILYTSTRYDAIRAKKRAYQLPDDQEEYIGWLVILELHFENPEQEARYRLDLLTILEDDLTWSEYALCYDQVLNRTASYAKLLDEILGESGQLEPIRAGARVLDLGAGTGNLTVRLAEPGKRRLVVALENNRPMLATMLSKCRRTLRNDDSGPGVIAIKQDITSLYGIQSNYFDYAVMNNVLYSLSDPHACLKETFRVLKPGGQLRLTGPQRSSDIKRLFRVLRKDLEQAGCFAQLQHAFQRVLKINELRLAEMPGFRWHISDVQKMLGDAGFTIMHGDDHVYGGHAMLLCGKK